MVSPSFETLNLPPASLWPRLGAGLIDLLVLYVQYQVVTFLFGLAGLLLGLVGRWLNLGGPYDLLVRGVSLTGWVWSAVVAVVYFPYWWQRDGRTFGMRMLKLRVVRANGPRREVGVGRAIWRGIASLVSLSPLALGYLWILIDERRQGWHDKLAGTLVVSTRPAPQRSDA